MTDLDALAVQVGREGVAYHDGVSDAAAILGARAMLAKLREMGLVVEHGTSAPPHNREPTAADFPTALRQVRSTTSGGTGHD